MKLKIKAFYKYLGEQQEVILNYKKYSKVERNIRYDEIFHIKRKFEKIFEEELD